MDKKIVNSKILLFFKNIDVSELNIECLKDKWLSASNQKSIFGKDKPHKKSAYFCFCKDERERLRKLDPPITKRDEVHKIMSSSWAKIKTENGSVYKKYEKLSEDSVEPNLKYEVTKPFHKFSIELRCKVEEDNPKMNAVEITNEVKKLWKEKTRIEKLNWSI